MSNSEFNFLSVLNPYGFISSGFFASPTFADIVGDGGLDAFAGSGNGKTRYYQNSGNAIAPSFTFWANDFVNLNFSNQQNRQNADLDTLINSENLISNRYGDSLLGKAESKVLISGLDEDTLDGNLGDDVINGSAGNYSAGYKLLLSALFCAFLSLIPATSFAGDRTYVSRNGSDANACTVETLPCRNLQRAINQAGADGEVFCLDSGFFGGFTITASVTIMCEQHIGQLGATLNVINLPANGVVILNGIDIDERNFGGNTLSFIGAGTLIIHNSSFRNGTNGVRFAPNGSAKLVITNSGFQDSTNAGVLIEPQTTGTFEVDLDGVKATNNLVGVSVFAGGGETVNLEIRNSLLQQNANYGFRSGSGSPTGAIQTHIDNSSVSNNGRGILSVGASSFVRVNRSVLTRNNIGFSTASGGSILSYGNNAVDSVTTTGGLTGTVGLQ